MPDRDLVLARVDLVALATEMLGPAGGSPRSPAWRCPDRGHPRADAGRHTVTAFLTRRGEQRWHCDTCGAGGTAIDLVMKVRRTSFRDALAALATRAGTVDPPTGGTEAAAASPSPPAGVGSVDGWIAHSAELLWEPYGEPVLEWLTEQRGIPAEVLRTNRIGATGVTHTRVLPTRRAVNGHRSASAAAVFPVALQTGPIHAQLRLIAPTPGEPAYLNPQRPDAVRPSLALYRPAKRVHPEIIVTEGVVDALTANAAGFRAAAVLSPGLVDGETALHLSRLSGPLVLALDPDGPGDEAADRLTRHLAAHGRRAAWLAALPGDLNEMMTAAHGWPRKLAAHVRHAAPGHGIDVAAP